MVKRLHILASSRPEFAPLASRVHAMFFLATPHQGASLARALSKFLAFGSGSSRPFVSDLSRQSLLVETLNREFPKHCRDIRIFSFFETIPTDIGFKKSLIVDRESAILGYTNERVDHLNANHRDICKYRSRDDPNYRVIRNALAAVVRDLRARAQAQVLTAVSDRKQKVRAFLAVQDDIDNNLLAATGRRTNGSCEWILRRSNFQRWLQSSQSSIFFLSGKPGTGKTILSGKVISHLQERGATCSYYFFRHTNRNTAEISSFLLSIARQMAMHDDEVLARCQELQQADEILNQRNFQSIWRKLFLDGVLTATTQHDHYWVIDALDECLDEGELVPMLLKAAELSSVRVFVSTRNAFNERMRPRTFKIDIMSEQISDEDCRSDITLFLEQNVHQLPTTTAQGRDQLMNRIIDKSQGSFLWIHLVFQELKNVYTSADVNLIMDEIPTDMNDLYARILDAMSKTTYGKPLISALIAWTACASRPLSMVELKEALELDIQEMVEDLESAIQDSCRQLIYIDGNSMVQMVHLTARDYLVDPVTKSEFAVVQSEAHNRIIRACLRCLHPGNMRRPRLGRTGGPIPRKAPSSFTRYASETLHQHLRHLSWVDPDVTNALAEFFSSQSVLRWIEYIAAHSDLALLIHTGEALSVFLNVVSEVLPKDSKEIALLTSWSTDLVRLVMQFGGNLKEYPAAIFNLIAPFCPTNTAPRKQFGSVPRGITVRGVQTEDWGDCLSTLSNPSQQHSSIASSKSHFAIGCVSGKIMVFQHVLYHRIAVLEHSEPVRLLSFGDQDNLLLSAGFKCVRLWDVCTKTELLSLSTPQHCMALSLANQGKLVFAATKDHQLKIWDVVDGRLQHSVNWTDGLQASALPLYRRPTRANFSVDAQLLAIVYKGQDILVWDIEGDCLYDIFNRELGATGFESHPYSSSGVRCLAFGTGASTDLLAAAYIDGEMVLFDITSGEIRKRRIDSFAHVMARSPDGSKLATADPAGTIHIFYFDTLEPLYRIDSVQPGIQDLAFSGDGQHLLDVRGSQCRVWGPAALAGHGDRPNSMQMGKVQAKSVEEAILITSIACQAEGEVFYCGKEDGSVSVYATESGMHISTLFSHASGVSIVSLEYDSKTHTITSTDTSSRVMIHRLVMRTTNSVTAKVMFDHRTASSINQLLCRPDLDRILFCSADTADLRCPSSDEHVSKLEYLQREDCHWTSHPKSPGQLLAVTRTSVHIFSWDSLVRLTPIKGLSLESEVPSPLCPRSALVVFDSTHLAIMYCDPSRPLAHCQLVLLDVAYLFPESESISPARGYEHLSCQAIHLIGSIGSHATERLVFLREGSWVSTIMSKEAKDGRIASHFFFPAAWVAAATQLNLMIRVTVRGDVLIVKGEEVAVIRRGLVRPEFMSLSQS